VKLYYDPDYTAAAYSFATTRKSGWIAKSLAERPVPGVELVSPHPLREEQVLRVHESRFVEAVRTGEPRGLAESQGFSWDEGVWTMVLASNGGAVAAGLTALREGVSGSLSSGIHHARAGTGAGYCTFNGLAIAAFEALDAGAESVLIVDLDGHCGGGTASLVRHEPRIWQVDVSVHEYDSYEPWERGSVRVVGSKQSYMDEVRAALAGVVFRPALCLYNAGMDAFGGKVDDEVLAKREQCVFDWCAERLVPVAFVIAGGYLGLVDQDELVAQHRLTIEQAAVHEACYR
jgi:acetoin utilization deacetylase AcuC-like enzyme